MKDLDIIYEYYKSISNLPQSGYFFKKDDNKHKNERTKQ